MLRHDNTDRQHIFDACSECHEPELAMALQARCTQSPTCRFSIYKQDCSKPCHTTPSTMTQHSTTQHPANCCCVSTYLLVNGWAPRAKASLNNATTHAKTTPQHTPISLMKHQHSQVSSAKQLQPAFALGEANPSTRPATRPATMHS